MWTRTSHVVRHVVAAATFTSASSLSVRSHPLANKAWLLTNSHASSKGNQTRVGERGLRSACVVVTNQTSINSKKSGYMSRSKDGLLRLIPRFNSSSSNSSSSSVDRTSTKKAQQRQPSPLQTPSLPLPSSQQQALPNDGSDKSIPLESPSDDSIDASSPLSSSPTFYQGRICPACGLKLQHFAHMMSHLLKKPKCRQQLPVEQVDYYRTMQRNRKRRRNCKQTTSLPMESTPS